MRNGVRKVIFSTCLLSSTAITAIGQSTQENTTKCQSADPDAKIAGCTALLKADQPTTMNRAVIYENRSVGYYSKGDYDHAIQDTDQAIHLNPNDPSSYYTRGLAYKKKENFDHAIQAFDEAIRLNPKFERAYYDRGNAYINKDEYDRAIQDFDEAIRLNPNNANNYNNRGVAYQRRGDNGRAIQNYSQAISLNPNDVVAYFNRGSAHFAESNLMAAASDFEHTISAAPSSSSGVYSALFLHIIMKRKGLDDAQQLARVAAAADLSKWPGPLLKLYLGQFSAAEAMKATTGGISDLHKYEVCQANYFSGEDALLHHQRTVAVAHLRAARDGCPGGATYRAVAAAEIKRLDPSAKSAK
jgi:tetratricopeptide (TPR) repeat protein